MFLADHTLQFRPTSSQKQTLGIVGAGLSAGFSNHLAGVVTRMYHATSLNNEERKEEE